MPVPSQDLDFQCHMSWTFFFSILLRLFACWYCWMRLFVCWYCWMRLFACWYCWMRLFACWYCWMRLFACWYCWNCFSFLFITHADILWMKGRRNCMVVEFTTTYAISAYHHWCCEFESQSGRGTQHYVIKFISDLRQFDGFLRVLRFRPPIKLTAMI